MLEPWEIVLWMSLLALVSYLVLSACLLNPTSFCRSSLAAVHNSLVERGGWAWNQLWSMQGWSGCRTVLTGWPCCCCCCWLQGPSCWRSRGSGEVLWQQREAPERFNTTVTLPTDSSLLSCP